MTKIGFVNYILQWFFIRLTRHEEKRVVTFNMRSATLMKDGQIGYSGTGEFKKFEWYSIQYWVLPLTGWWSNFIYLNKSPKFKELTGKKEVNA